MFCWDILCFITNDGPMLHIITLCQVLRQEVDHQFIFLDGDQNGYSNN